MPKVAKTDLLGPDKSVWATFGVRRSGAAPEGVRRPHAALGTVAKPDLLEPNTSVLATLGLRKLRAAPKAESGHNGFAKL